MGRMARRITVNKMEELGMINLYYHYAVLSGNDDKPFIKTNKDRVREIYYSSYFNSLIVFEPMNEAVDDIGGIINGLPKEYFNWLMDKLPTESNLVVHWTQLEGTTSDFVIYYDLNPSNLELTNFNSVKNVLKKYDSIPYKYVEVKNGIATPINFKAKGIILDETIWKG